MLSHQQSESAVVPCRPECWSAWSQKYNLKESSSGSGGGSPAWRGPAGHSGSFPAREKLKKRMRAGRRLRRNDGGSSHHHKLAQLEDLGELIAHAEKTQDTSVTPLIQLYTNTHAHTHRDGRRHCHQTATRWPSGALIHPISIFHNFSEESI